MCFKGVMWEEMDCCEWKGQDVRETLMAVPLLKQERSRANGE